MEKLAKLIVMVSAISAVPIGLLMAGVLVLALATETYGITSKWKASEIFYVGCGVIYPALAVLSSRKVKQQDSQKLALSWALMPLPILLYLVVAGIDIFSG